MGRATDNMTPEQQELLDSGLRMLAHMIAETHLRRTALKKKNACATHSTEMAEHTEREKPRESSCENLPEDCDE